MQCCSGWSCLLQFLGSLGTSLGLSGIHYLILQDVSPWRLCVVCRSLSQLMKWWTKGEGYGQAQVDEAPYVGFDLFCSVETLYMIILLMASNHTMNLFSWRWIRSWQKLISHPRIIFCSSRRAPVFSLFLASIVSLGMSSFLCSGHEQVWNARRNHIEQGCLSLLCPLPGKWGCQCSHWLCLVGWCQFQQSTRGCPRMGSNHPRI